MAMDLFGVPAAEWLPIAFAVVMGVSILAYVILDGYDLGVGMLMAGATRAERDMMVGSIGPFWDANETWLVLGIGILLVAFPVAHGIILSALYLPVALMLLGLTIRGVAFEFRVKAQTDLQTWWDRAFVAGSTLAAVTQGYMLGAYIVGFSPGFAAQAFALLIGLCLAAGYAFIGATWLLLKTAGDLQARAARHARLTLGLVALGMAAVSLATPIVSERIFAKWFSFPAIIALAPIPLMTGLVFVGLWIFLKRMPRTDHSLDYVPFAGAMMLFVLGFAGLGFSFYPYVIPERMTVWQAAASPESLMIIFVGALVVLPVIVAYSAFAYWVFRGKATALRYD
jgi:cytochrome d ubiquinol oxidase subunit II